MAYIGHANYVVIVLSVGGYKASNINLVLHREPRTGKTWFLADSILPNEEHVDVVVRELHEQTGLTLTYDDLTLLSINNPVRVSLREGKHHLDELDDKKKREKREKDKTRQHKMPEPEAHG